MTSSTRRWRWVSPSPSAARSGNARTVAAPVSAAAFEGALRPPGGLLFSAPSPPRPPLARRLFRRTDGSASDGPDQTHVRSFPVSCGFRRTPAVDIEQSFDRTHVRSRDRSTGYQGGRVMGRVQQAVLEFDEEVRAPWRPRLVPDVVEPAEVREPRP